MEKIPKSGKFKKLVDEYKQEIEMCTVGKGWQLTLDMIKLFTERLESRFEAEAVKIEKEIDKAKESTEFEFAKEKLRVLSSYTTFD